MILADVLKRWQQLREKTALMLTGTDEHGMKVVVTDITLFMWLIGGSPVDSTSCCQSRQRPKNIRGQRSRNVQGAKLAIMTGETGLTTNKTLSARANVKQDYFIRTTDPAHKEAVEYAWVRTPWRGFYGRG